MDQPCGSLESNFSSYAAFSDVCSPKNQIHQVKEENTNDLISEFYTMGLENDTDPLETKIHAWLDQQGIKQVDPRSKEYEYFQNRKSLLFQDFNVALTNSEDCIDLNNQNDINQNEQEINNSNVQNNSNLKSQHSSPIENREQKIQQYHKKLSCDLTGSGLFKRRQRKNTCISYREINVQ